MTKEERFVLWTPDPALYRQERDRVLTQLQKLLPEVDVREVGSTAIPGVIGKGDIDFLVRPEAGAFALVRQRLDQVFARNPIQLSNDIYQGYNVASPMDVAIQLTVKDGPYDDFLPFIETLLQEPALVAEYNALKRRWDGHAMAAYRAAKQAFIERILKNG